MRRALILSTLLFSFSAGAAAQSLQPESKQQPKKPVVAASTSPAALQAARASFARLPLSFEQNQGQTDSRVKFLSRGDGYSLFLTADEAVIALRGGSFSDPSKKAPEGAALWLKMLGAKASAQVSGSELLPGKINYYVGNDPSKWRTGVRQYGKVSYRGIYPGVDLTYYGNQQQLESDFVVAPGANPRAIEFEVAGARETRLDPRGNLVLVTGAGNVQLLRPVVYQTINGVRRDISGRYILRGRNRVGFEIGKYDPRRTLIIDPTLLYSTYLGGSTLSTGDAAYAIAIDASGDAYVTGGGTSADFPGDDLNGPPVLTLSNFAFVTVFNPTGSSNGAALIYSTIIAGSTQVQETVGTTSNTIGYGIALDTSGNAYIAGVTSATNLPVVNPFQATYGSASETGFVVGLKNYGTLIYSTYLGGRNDTDMTELKGLAADSAGNAYVVGDTTSPNFPVVNGLAQGLKGTQNVVVAQFNNQGQPIYSTYLGGSSTDYGFGIAADANQNAYVTGYTLSTDFPVQTTPAPLQSTNKGNYDVFVSKLTFNSGTSTLALANSTFLGGTSTDEGFAIAVDAASPPNVYITGETFSSGASGFPTKTPIYATNAGASDVFITKLLPDFSGLVFSTYLGGAGTDIGYAIALDKATPPNVFVTGLAASGNFPMVNPMQPIPGSGSANDSFVAEVNSGGTALTYSTYLGGSAVDTARAIAVSASDNAYIAGKTTSPNFPILSGATAGTEPFQNQLKSSAGNAFVVEISPATGSGITFFPPVYDFHTVPIGQGGFEAIILTNNTGAAVTIGAGAITFTGANPGDFAQVNACPVSPATLAAGASCGISVTFTPMDQDGRSATLNVVTSGGSGTVNLTGTGGVPEASFSATSITFFPNPDPLNVQAVSSVTVTNTGGGLLQIGSAQIGGANPAPFSVQTSSSSCFSGTIAPGSSCVISVAFTPTTPVTSNASLLVSSNAAGSPQSITLTGTGIQEVLVSPTSLELNPNVVGSTSMNNANEATLVNGSGGAITITETAGTGADQGDFHVYPGIDTCSTVGQLAAGGTCRLAVYFQPLAASATDGRTGSYTLGWTGTASGSQVVNLMGTGLTGVSLYTNNITGPSEYVGITESSTGLEAIFNGTSSAVTITTTLSGNNPGDFTSTLDPTCAPNGVIPADTYCSVDLSFTPSALGLRTVTITYGYSGTGITSGILTLNGSGTGIPGPVQFPAAYGFGSEIINTTTPKHVFEFRNVSTVPITISSVGLSGNPDFVKTTDSTCVAGSIPAGGVCYIGMTFTPTSSGTQETASVVITDAFAGSVGADPGSPHTLNITGIGEPSVITVSVSSGSATLLDFGNVALSPATPPQAEIFLTNAGNSSTTITWSSGSPALNTASTAFSLVASGANLTTCTQSKVVLPQGGTCLIGIAFNPTTSGEQTNSITFTDSVTGSGSPHTVQIQGNAVAVAKVTLTPTSLTFNQTPGLGPAQTVTLTNTSTVATGAPLIITTATIAASGASNFAIASGTNQCTVGESIAPTATCNFYVTFTAPVTPGSSFGELEVQNSLGNNTTSTNFVSLDGNSVSGGFTLSPAGPITFGNVAVGSSSTSVEYTLTNENTTTATFGMMTLPAGYSIAFDDCSNTAVQSGGECFFEISFAPGSAGADNGNLQIPYTGPTGTSFSVGVQGTGVAAVAASPNPVNFGNISPGGSGFSTVTIGNGAATTATITSVSTPLASTGFAISFNGCPNPTALTTLASCMIDLSFTAPAAATAGLTSTTFTVGYSVSGVAQTPITVTLQATIAAAQAVVTTPASGAPLIFPTQTINTQSQILNVVITNSASASASLSFTSFRITGNDFSLATINFSNSCQFAFLAPGQSCTIPIAFTPSKASGTNGITGTLTITDNSSPATQVVNLEGTGVAGSVSMSPSTLTFPTTNVGTFLTLGANFTNASNAPVTFTGVTYAPTGGPYTTDTGVNACVGGKAVPALGNCVVYVRFTPTNGNTVTSTATIAYSGGSVTLNLSGTGFNPGPSVTPGTLNFAAQPVGTASTAQTVTLNNPTASSVTVSSITNGSISGTNPSDFSVSANTCGVVLAGGSCTVNVTFDPAAGGVLSRAAILTISDATDANSPHMVTLNGTAMEPIATLNQNTMAFGNSNVNVTTGQLTATLTNTGNATLTGLPPVLSGAGFAFTTPISGTDCTTLTTLTAGSSCTVAATFTPTTTGLLSATITFTDNATPNHQVVNLSGTGTQAVVTISSPVTFPGQRLHTTSSVQSATLSNTGTGPVTGITVSSGSNPEFAFTTPPSGADCRTVGTVAAGSTCLISLTFTPTLAGLQNETLTVGDSVGNSNVSVNGTGIAPTATLNVTTIPFGNQIVSTTSATSADVNLKNTGTDTLNIASILAGGANPTQYKLVAPGDGVSPCTLTGTFTLAAGASCNFGVQFAPTATGSLPASVIITDDSGAVLTDVTQTVTLTGTGVTAPTATPSPSPVPFANQRLLTTSAAIPVTVSNTGGAPLTVASIALAATGNFGDFVLSAGTTNPCPLTGGTVAAGTSCTFNVAFKPTVANVLRTASVTVTDNANATGTPGTTQTVNLTGTGIAPVASVPALPFGNRPINQAATLPLTVSNTGTDTLNLAATNAIVITPAGSAFGTTTGTGACANGAAIPAGGTCTVYVTFAPTTASQNYTATLTVTDDSGAVAGSTQPSALSGTGVTSTAVLNPNPLIFATAQKVNSTSAASTVTLSNVGTAALNIASIGAVTGTNPGDFAPATAAAPVCTVGTPVAIGASCNLAFTFAPTGNGARTAQVVFTDDASGAGSTQTLSLMGTGIEPVVQLAPASPLSFNAQIDGTTSAPQTVTLSNVGSDTLTIGSVAINPASTNASDFAITANTCTAGAQIGFAAGSNTCTVTLTFTPGGAGLRGPAALIFTDNAGETTGTTQTINLAGTGQAPPTAIVPATVPLGNQRLQTTGTATSVTVTNNGDASLAITSIGFANTGNPLDFVLSPGPVNPCSLTGTTTVLGHNSCTFNVAFKPTATGSRTAAVTLTDNANTTGTPGTTQTVNLTGNGIAPTALVPGTLAFGNRTINQTATLPLVVTNTGTDTLNLAASNAITITPAGSVFAIGTGTGACANGQAIPANTSNTCTIYVTFTPTVVQTYPSVTLTVTDDSGAVAGSTQISTLSGAGVTSTAVLNPAALTFANSQRVNTTSASSPVTLTNTGTAALNFSNISAVTGTNPGDFASATATAPVCTAGTPVAAGSSCNIAFTFKPTATGTRTAQVVFTDDANGVTGGSTQTLTLTGTGIAPTATVTTTPTSSPLAITFANQIVLTTSATSGDVNLKNTGTDTLNIASIALGGANPTQYKLVAPGDGVSPCTLTAGIPLAAGASCNFGVQFAPTATATGSQPASVVITDDTGAVLTDVTQIITLTGTGVTAPTATPSPSPVPFANQRLLTTSAAIPVTVSNTGGAPLTVASIALAATGNFGDFVLSAGATNPCPLTGGTVAAGTSCTFNVAFKPTVANVLRTASVTLTDNANATGTPGTTQTVNLTGTGIAPVASVPALPFGNRTINQTAMLPLTVSNTGTDTLNLAATNAIVITPAGSAFGTTTGTGACTNGAAIPAGGTCTVYVTFAPTTAGLNYTAALTVTDDSGAVAGTTQTSALSGAGVTTTAVLNPTALTFANSQRVNTTSAASPVTITNTGTAALNFSNISALTGTNPGDFASATATAPACTVGTPVAAGSSCNLAFTFKPTATGTRTAQVVFTDDASGISGSTQTLTLTGTGIAPLATLNTTAIPFGNQIVSTISATSADVNLKNTGADTLNVASILLGGANPLQYKLVAPGDGVSPCTLTAGFALAAGASCNFGAQFAPTATATGSQPASVVITDDSGAVTGSTQTVTLTGTGVTPPTAVLNPTALPFATPQRVNTTSTAMNLSVTNTGGANLALGSITLSGTDAGQYILASAPNGAVRACVLTGDTLPTSGSCNVTVEFAPLSSGTKNNAAVTFTDNANATGTPGTTQNVALTGNAIAPVVALVPATLPAFANTEVNTSSAAQSGVLNNTGTDTLHITNVAITGANPSDFLIVAAGTSCETGLPTAVTVTASGSCTWSVQFRPTALGSRTASLTFTDDNNAVPGTTESIALSGMGTAPMVVLAPTTVTFPAQALTKASSPMGGTLTNTGNAALHLAATGAVTIGAPGNAVGDFAINGPGTSCANNLTVAQTTGTCTWSVTFTPTANGTRTATLIFTDDANGTTGSTQTVTLTGVTPAAATLSPSTLPAFAAQGVGTNSTPATITVSNPGGSPLVFAATNAFVVSGTNPGDFTVAGTGTTPCANGSTVAPLASCTLNVTFNPAAAGSRGPATLTITDNAGGTAGATQTVQLSGTGISFSLNIQATPPATAAGQPIMATIQLTPGTGGFPNAITFSATGLPPSSMGSFNPPTLTAPINALTTSTFTLTTAARSGAAPRPSRPTGPLSGGWIVTAILSLLAMLTVRRGSRMQRFAYLPLAVLLLSAAIITGCTSSGPTGTPAGSYNVTVTATAGSYSQSTTIPITVQ